ncbi:MAG: bifunctional phosphopantothenoylcysteine decarboxylase/phosphopantothenate--cysteine ligase CoaBC [SAR86 cluster bacterium]|uniref:Bifunctional phosphopantothenoylcysteine decarboxylase/phosphopantothenate--cysteine ligase CoaBC n=1 Tax=SAR86 cluster bacterium TaxID=2030880 RepID=A0A2A4MTV9_9GAMM|nr:MAG: bifunctional phosphopantothenoylcysteine decarboxylase/phosphopantothenate--cysteine ligase CoaBC [SAR86 cluster bacterium]
MTAGPTREAIDPVRYISNHSSGKMGYAIAKAAQELGAQVTLISGPVSLTTPHNVNRIDVVSAAQMHQQTLSIASQHDIFIACAAVADYRPVAVESEKIKKHDQQMQITLIKNPDIISQIAALKQRPIVVGFAAETQQIVEHGRDKLQRKNLDILFANNATETFNSDDIQVTALTKHSEQEIGPANKASVARTMLQMIATYTAD